MAYPEVIIPPSVKPESPYEPQLIDDQTTLFSPRFGRGTTQRQLWGDPLWGWRLRYRALSGADRALVRAAILEARGKAVNIRVTPGQPLRGSFPATELLTNNDFSNETTGWSATSVITHTVQDRVSRGTINTGALYPQIYQSPASTQYAPHALRSFIAASDDLATVNVGPAISDGTSQTDAYTLERGLRTIARTALTTPQSVFPWVATTAVRAGNFVDCSWTSYSRCIFVDNGPNALIESAAIENSTYWGRSGLSTVTSGGTAPDGTATSRSLVENSSAGSHYCGQTVTGLSASAADYSFSIYVKAATRSYGYIQLVEITGGSAAYSYFDLTDGTWDTESVGANWSNLRKHITSCGNGWYRLTITAQKTNAATSITGLVGLANAANAGTYTGDGTSYFEVWHGSMAQSSLPVRDRLTTSAATTGTAQTGSRIYVKGLPASTSGLLLAGDFIEINGELKQVTSSLDSDAAGLGVLSFRPSLWVAPADNDPIIVNNPMGRFRLAGDPRITENFGVYTDVELDLIEAGP